MSLSDMIPGGAPAAGTLEDPRGWYSKPRGNGYGNSDQGLGRYALSGLEGLGLGSLSDSQQLQLMLAATQAVHKDIESGVSLDRTFRDLSFARNSITAVPPGDMAMAQAALDSAERDYAFYEAHQAGAQSAASGFQSSTGALQQHFASGGGEIDTGSGDFTWDAASGTARDMGFNLGKVLTYATNFPQAKCAITGGTWNENAQACSGGSANICDAIPGPLGWVCKNPGKALAIGAGVLGAWFFGPSILHKAVQTERAFA